jgi:hypothetical protein
MLVSYLRWRNTERELKRKALLLRSYSEKFWRSLLTKHGTQVLLFISPITPLSAALESLPLLCSVDYSSVHEIFLRIPISKLPVSVCLLMDRDHSSTPSVQKWRVVQLATYFVHLLRIKTITADEIFGGMYPVHQQR